MATPDLRQRFADAYAGLNAAQRQAVDTIEGPVMVIAGPGTGKTQILALRIANILDKTDTSPSSILALTFTESGVASMRARLVSLIGQDGYRVRIHTFHGFCNEVMRSYPDYFPDSLGKEPLIELDAIRIIKHILDDMRPERLRPHGAPDLYVRDITSKLSEVKREHITPEALRARITEERARIESADDLYHAEGAHAGKMKGAYALQLGSLAKADEFVQVYEAYEAALAEEGKYDFDDTILTVVETLARNEELKLIVQEEHQYILADEHQDANGSQNELLTLLSDFHESPNLFIVGDEKQAIYRFQGASLENFFGFQRRWPDAVLVSLVENYRSTQRILDAAHELIAPADSGEMERHTLEARASHADAAIPLVIAPDEDSERSELAALIAANIERGESAREIVVLLRRNGDVAQVAAALARRGIPYVAYGDDPVLAHPVVAGFITYLRAVAEPGDDALLYQTLVLPYSGISALDVYRLTTPPLYERGSLRARLSNPEELQRVGVTDVAACRALAARLDASFRLLPERTLIECIEQMLWSSGCMAHALGRTDALEALAVVKRFFQYLSTMSEAHPEYTLADVLVALDEAKTYRLALGSAQYAAGAAVSIMTAHRAKGMEFDHVYIPHAHDKRWGGTKHVDRLKLPLYGADGATQEDDERRLFYVAMTRARKTLTISYAERSGDGTTLIPSRFIDEIKDAHLAARRIEETQFFVAPAKSVALPVLREEEKAYLRERFLSNGLSVSALNNFIESPWKYFFVNLLRVPSARAPHLMYGIAIDETLKWYAITRNEGKMPEDAEVLAVFVAALKRQPFVKNDFETYRVRGTTALSGYLKQYAQTWVEHTESAVRIAVPFETTDADMPLITLRGELDKVECIDEHTVRVVDYKTGAPKSRGVITGTTKGGTGGLFRQLAFYALMISRDDTRSWRTNEGVLDFVEPDKKGAYKREQFLITDEHMQTVAAEIDAAVRSISTFDFWDTPCDEACWSAEGCALVAAIRGRSTGWM